MHFIYGCGYNVSIILYWCGASIIQIHAETHSEKLYSHLFWHSGTELLGFRKVENCQKTLMYSDKGLFIILN